MVDESGMKTLVILFVLSVIREPTPDAFSTSSSTIVQLIYPSLEL